MALIWWFLAQTTPEARFEADRIVVSGKSDLPDGTVITVVIHSFGCELARETIEIKEGSFRRDFSLNWPAQYLVRVSFEPLSQTRIAVAQKLKERGLDKDQTWNTQVSIGTRDQQIEGWRQACRRLEGRIDEISKGVEGFFALMVDPPKAWNEQQTEAIERIRRQAKEAHDDIANRIYGLDDTARNSLADLAHLAEQAVLLRAKGEGTGKLAEALEKAVRVRQTAQTLRERLAPTILKKSEIEEMVRRLESCDSEQAAPILQKLTHALGTKHYARISEIGEFIETRSPKLKQALAEFLASLLN